MNDEKQILILVFFFVAILCLNGCDLFNEDEYVFIK